MNERMDIKIIFTANHKKLFISFWCEICLIYVGYSLQFPCDTLTHVRVIRWKYKKLTHLLIYHFFCQEYLQLHLIAHQETFCKHLLNIFIMIVIDPYKTWNAKPRPDVGGEGRRRRGGHYRNGGHTKSNIFIIWTELDIIIITNQVHLNLKM